MCPFPISDLMNMSILGKLEHLLDNDATLRPPIFSIYPAFTTKRLSHINESKNITLRSIVELSDNGLKGVERPNLLENNNLYLMSL